MFNKKICILLLLIVSICAISTVSAADNATDAVAIDDASAGDAITNFDEDTIETAEEIADGEKLSANDDSALTKDQTDDVLSAPTSSYDLYNIYFEEDYEISSYSKGTIKGTISPPPSYMPQYSFRLAVFDLDEEIVFLSDSITGRSTSFSYTIPANTLLPGMYDLYAVNDWDTKVMAFADLYVTGNSVITSSDFNANYMSNSKMTAKIVDKKSKKPLTSLGIDVVFTSGNIKKTELYMPDENGQIFFEPPVGVGTWTVTFSPNAYKVTGSVVKTAIIKKSSVSIKANKVTEYTGHKTTLKAVVTCNGRNVNEGTVTFKINKKSYTAPVKNGVATVQVNLKKVKTYKFTAKFNGNNNLAASNVVNSKAVLKKSFKTKLYAKNYQVYIFKKKVAKILVKTKNGKKVKNGKLQVTIDGKSIFVNVKNGVGKITLKGLSAVDHFKGFTRKGETYKRFITKKVKIKYIPTSHKYKASSIKIKVRSVFKCPGCGKTTTHFHKAHDSDYRPYKHFIAIV